MAITSGPNETSSQTPGNLFPLHKLKSNHIFTAQAATVGNDEVEADTGAKQEGGETEPLADKGVQASGRGGGTGWPMECIIALPRQLNYTNRKMELVSDVEVLTTSCGIAQKTLANCMESSFKYKRGDGKEGRLGP